MKKTIIFTGGGTAGHVTPNIALINKFKEMDYNMAYIGSKEGIEKKLILDEKIDYYAIPTGKLRRYKDIKNVTDVFKVIGGILKSFRLIGRIKPDVIFSKGGFVAVPVVIAAYFRRVPIVIHESDMTPGLANKISMLFTKNICVNFPESLGHFKNKKVALTGTPIRKELLEGNRKKGFEFAGIKDNKPVIMIMGGSLGSEVLNKAIRESLDEILKDFSIVHLCGKNKLDESLKGKEGYAQFEYVSGELKDLFEITDLMISRAGANSIYETLILQKPNILIPLTKKVSRGDQILNAESFEKQGFSKVIFEEKLTSEILLKNIRDVHESRERYINNMKESSLKDGTERVIEVIKKCQK